MIYFSLCGIKYLKFFVSIFQLTVEDYVQIVETLVHDVRFTAYNVCYKRLLMAWLITSFVILLGLLFSGAKGLTLFGCGVIWLIINAAAIFVCMWLKNKVNLKILFK